MCDAKLIALMLSGDVYAADKLVKKHKIDLLGFCSTKLLNSQLAEDCYQMTWEKAFRNLHTYNQNYSFKSWIFKICQNTIYDELRRHNAKMRGEAENTQKSLRIEYYEKLLARQRTTEQLAVDKELRRELLGAVYALPEKYKDVVILRFFHDKTFSEISELLQLPESTVKGRQSKAIELLKKSLGVEWYV